jgi:hypothetical protein
MMQMPTDVQSALADNGDRKGICVMHMPSSRSTV